MAIRRQELHSKGMVRSSNKVVAFISRKSKKEILFPVQKASRLHQADNTGWEPPLAIVLLTCQIHKTKFTGHSKREPWSYA